MSINVKKRDYKREQEDKKMAFAFNNDKSKTSLAGTLLASLNYWDIGEFTSGSKTISAIDFDTLGQDHDFVRIELYSTASQPPDPEGGVYPTYVRKKEGEVIVNVSDTWRGITEIEFSSVVAKWGNGSMTISATNIDHYLHLVMSNTGVRLSDILVYGL